MSWRSIRQHILHWGALFVTHEVPLPHWLENLVADQVWLAISRCPVSLQRRASKNSFLKGCTLRRWVDLLGERLTSFHLSNDAHTFTIHAIWETDAWKENSSRFLLVSELRQGLRKCWFLPQPKSDAAKPICLRCCSSLTARKKGWPTQLQSTPIRKSDFNDVYWLRRTRTARSR